MSLSLIEGQSRTGREQRRGDHTRAATHRQIGRARFHVALHRVMLANDILLYNSKWREEKLLNVLLAKMMNIWGSVTKNPEWIGTQNITSYRIKTYNYYLSVKKLRCKMQSKFSKSQKSGCVGGGLAVVLYIKHILCHLLFIVSIFRLGKN